MGQYGLTKTEGGDEQTFKKQKSMDESREKSNPKKFCAGYEIDDFVCGDSEEEEEEYFPKKKKEYDIFIPIEDRTELPSGLQLIDCLNDKLKVSRKY